MISFAWVGGMAAWIRDGHKVTDQVPARRTGALAPLHVKPIVVDAAYVKEHYPRGKADLYAAFLERGLQLVKDGGTSAMLTMRCRRSSCDRRFRP